MLAMLLLLSYDLLLTIPNFFCYCWAVTVRVPSPPQFSLLLFRLNGHSVIQDMCNLSFQNFFIFIIHKQSTKCTVLFIMYFIHNVLTNMFWPLLQPSSGCCYYCKNTKVQMWVAMSPELDNN